MIKVAPKEYHINCLYDEAILYCFQLNIDGNTGWRLPTRDEYNEFRDIPPFSMTSDYHLEVTATCVPVKDI